MKIRKALCGFLIAFAIPLACMAESYVQEENNANVSQETESVQNMPPDGIPQRGGGGRMGGGRGGAPGQNGEMPSRPEGGQMPQGMPSPPDAGNQDMMRGGGGRMGGGQGGMRQFGQQMSETKLDRVKAFCSKNFTPLFSLASLVFGFFFVILYKRKKY